MVALDMSENGIRAYNDYIHSPGFPFIEMLLLNISKNVPLPLGVLLITMGLWAIFMERLRSAIVNCFGVSKHLALLFPILLALYPLVSLTYIIDLLLLADPIATAFFAIALLESWRLFVNLSHNPILNKSNKLHAIVIGFLFAGASYTRVQFDLIFVMLIFTTLSLIILAKILKLNKDWKIYLIGIVVVFLSYNLLTIPYKISIKSASMGNNSFEWEGLWHDDAYWIAKGWDFKVVGGETVVCELDKIFCNEVQARVAKGEVIRTKQYFLYAVKTILKHPIQFLLKKTPYLAKAWKIDFYTAETRSTIFSYLLLLFVPLTVVSFYFANKKSWVTNSALYIVYLVSIVTATIGFSMIVHFEPRYLLPIKLFILIAFLLSAANWLAKSKNKSMDSYV